MLGGTALVALRHWSGLGGGGLDDLAGGAVYDAVVVSAGLACLLRASQVRAERGAWLAIGASVLVWSAAEVYWTAEIAGNPSAPYPSLADVGYLLFYPLAALGLALLVRARSHELDWRLWVDGLIAALGTAALGTTFVFDFVADQATGSSLEVATTLAYPLGDILMLSLVVGVIALTRWRPGRTGSLLLAGLAALAVADVAYTLQSTGEGLPGGNWIDPIYLIGAVLLGSEAWLHRATAIPSAPRFDGWRELLVPVLFATVMIVLFATQYFGATSVLSTMLWVATMIAILFRLGVTVRENKQLLQQVRTDGLTGLGNRGGMEIDLKERCEAASAAQPISLTLFDLDGFKRFNDTFGHPAGDEMLKRLGGRLHSALGPDGHGYRIGGDEFCVIVEGQPERHEAVVKQAAEALSSHERGVDVTPSWGAVAIPAEAETPSEAMQLADVRMYAQKESRRLSHDAVLAAERAKVEAGGVEPPSSVGDRKPLEQGQ
ncbi:MAG TPA: GGDEF domain-containing protein [Solirubrobacterales bacterium]|nr:GGDEF domain-containing protein [Solirubrobacterales bacterium]